MEKEFTNKVALVTGGAMGIGKAVALLLAEKGAKVVIIDKAKDEAAKVVKEITGDAIAIQADVSKSSDVKNTIEETVKKFGKIDIVSNNAGIQRYGTVESNFRKRMG